MSNFQKLGAVSYNEDAVAEDVANRATERPRKERQSIQKGTNVYMMFPLLSRNGVQPWRRLHIHWNYRGQKCFHVCLRDDPYEDASGQVEEDRNFYRCPHCREAWETWRDGAAAAGFKKASDYKYTEPGNRKSPPHPEFQFFRDNMPSHQGLILTLTLTPFFDTRGPRPKANKKLIAKFFANFMEIVKLVGLGEDVDQALFDEMPEDMQKAALCGISPMLVGKTVVDGIANAYRQRFWDNDEQDPLMSPDKYLLQIDRTPDPSKVFGGRVASDYVAQLASLKMIGEVEDIFWPVAQELSNAGKLIDIYTLDREWVEAAVEDKIDNMARLSEDELVELLAERRAKISEAAANEAALPQEFEDAAPTRGSSNPTPQVFDPSRIGRPAGARSVGGNANVLDDLKGQFGLQSASDLDGDDE